METESKASGLKKKRKIFGWVFVASILVFFASSMVLTLASMRSDEFWASEEQILKEPSRETLPHPLSNQALSPSALDTAVIISVVSLLTSLTSLVAFFSTTILAWRKEKRETVMAELEIKKKELEIEQLKIKLASSEKSGMNEST